MRLSKAIQLQEREIAILEEEINYLIKIDIQKAIKKQQRKELLIRQINLAKVINL